MVLHIVVHKTTGKPIQVEDEDGCKKTLIFDERRKAEVFMNIIDEKIQDCYVIRLYKSMTTIQNTTSTVAKFASVAEVRAQNIKRIEAEKEAARLKLLEEKAEQRLREHNKYVNNKAKMKAIRELEAEEATEALPSFLK